MSPVGQSVVGKEDFIQKHQADNIRPQSFELPIA